MRVPSCGFEGLPVAFQSNQSARLVENPRLRKQTAIAAAFRDTTAIDPQIGPFGR